MSIPVFLQLWRIPLRRWPWHYHLVPAAVLLLGCALAGGWALQRASLRLADLQSAHAAVQQQLHALQNRPPDTAPADFTQSLPSAAHADEVARDIGRFAQSAGVQISSLTVEARPAGATELGRVHFNVAAQAPYRASKDWLAELLARYASLGVQSLSLQALPNDAARQDIRVTLVWFVRE